MTRKPIVPVARLFDVPDGYVRRGDEIHDPDNWVHCRACGVDCPADAEDCFNCGEPLVE